MKVACCNTRARILHIVDTQSGIPPTPIPIAIHAEDMTDSSHAFVAKHGLVRWVDERKICGGSNDTETFRHIAADCQQLCKVVPRAPWRVLLPSIPGGTVEEEGPVRYR